MYLGFCFLAWLQIVPFEFWTRKALNFMGLDFFLNIVVPVKEKVQYFSVLGRSSSAKRARSGSFQDCPGMSSSFLSCDIICSEKSWRNSVTFLSFSLFPFLQHSINWSYQLDLPKGRESCLLLAQETFYLPIVPTFSHCLNGWIQCRKRWWKIGSSPSFSLPRLFSSYCQL